VFRDECLEYARRLVDVGVPVEFHLFPGAFHGWTMATGTRLAEQATATEFAAVQRALQSLYQHG
jgi:acetyl esterase/lipase